MKKKGYVICINKYIKNRNGDFFVEYFDEEVGREDYIEGRLMLCGKNIFTFSLEPERLPYGWVGYALKEANLIIHRKEHGMEIYKCEIVQSKGYADVDITDILEMLEVEIDNKSFEEGKLSNTISYRTEKGMLLFNNVLHIPSIYKYGYEHFKLFLNPGILKIKEDSVVKCEFTGVGTKRNYDKKLYEQLITLLDTEKNNTISTGKLISKYKVLKNNIFKFRIIAQKHGMEYDVKFPTEPIIVYDMNDEQYIFSVECEEIIMRTYWALQDDKSMEVFFSKSLLLGVANYLGR